MPTKVIFDFADSGYQGWWLWLVSLISLIGIAAHVITRLRRSTRPFELPIELSIALAILVAGAMLWMPWRPYFDYLDILKEEKTGEYQIVEGTIDNLTRAESKRTTYTFMIGDVHFSVDSATILFRPIFYLFDSQKMKEGLKYRIFYTYYGSESAILRIESL